MQLLLTVLLNSALVVACCAVSGPETKTYFTNFSALEQDTVHLMCNGMNETYSSRSRPPVDWKRRRLGEKHESLIFTGLPFVKNDDFGDRFQLFGETSLIIEDVIIEDSGLYYCIDNVGGDSPIQTIMHLNVSGLRPTLYLADQGENVRLTCNVTSRPVVPPVEWKYRKRPEEKLEHYVFIFGPSGTRRNDDFSTRFELDATTMSVVDVELADSGIYYCVDNARGDHRIRNIMYLTVSKPEVFPVIDVKEGQRVDVPCDLSAESSVATTRHVDWTYRRTKKKIEIYVYLSSLRAYVEDFVPRFKANATILTVYNVSVNDSGIYSCVEAADNDDGKRSNVSEHIDSHSSASSATTVSHVSRVDLQNEKLLIFVSEPENANQSDTVRDIIVSSNVAGLALYNITVNESGIHYCIEDADSHDWTTVSECYKLPVVIRFVPPSGKSMSVLKLIGFGILAAVVVVGLWICFLGLRNKLCSRGDLETVTVSDTADGIAESSTDTSSATEMLMFSSRTDEKLTEDISCVDLENQLLKEKCNKLQLTSSDRNLDLTGVVNQLVAVSILNDSAKSTITSGRHFVDLLRLLDSPGLVRPFRQLRLALGANTNCSELVRRLDALAFNVDGTINEKHSTVTTTVAVLPNVERILDNVQKDPQPVHGLAFLNGNVYVLRTKDYQIEVYRPTSNSADLSAKYKFIRYLMVTGIKGLEDMIACEHNRCLYIAGRVSKTVHKVAIHGDTSEPVLVEWQIGDEPSGLSVMKDLNVLATCHETRLLRVISHIDGHLVRNIQLGDDIERPWHSVEVLPGIVAVSNGDIQHTVHRVCFVDGTGQIIRSYGRSKGEATVGQLNVPHRLAVDDDGFIYVADRDNKRVVLLSPMLQFVREVVRTNDWADRMCLNVTKRTMFIADTDWVTKSRVFEINI